MTAALVGSSPVGTRSAAAWRVYEDPRPLLRGRLHQLSFFLSIPAGIRLVEAAAPAARWSVVVFAVTWTIMFGTSAAYHRLAQSPRARFWMRRADHTTIFVHIAGANTPICLLAMPHRIGIPVLVAVWAVAIVGMALKLTRLTETCHAGSHLYPVLATVPFLSLPWLAVIAGGAAVVFLTGSGLLYAVGGVVFFKRSPDPIPTVFGFHEVWHVFTVLGGLCQFAVTVLLAVG